MSPNARTFARGLSAALALAAVTWAGFVVRQVFQSDDGEPPLGAMCSAVPAFLLLIAAAAVWPNDGRAP